MGYDHILTRLSYDSLANVLGLQHNYEGQQEILSKLEGTENLDDLCDTSNDIALCPWINLFEGRSPSDNMRLITAIQSKFRPPKDGLLHGFLDHFQESFSSARQTGGIQSMIPGSKELATLLVDTAGLALARCLLQQGKWS